MGIIMRKGRLDVFIFYFLISYRHQFSAVRDFKITIFCLDTNEGPTSTTPFPLF